MENVILIIHLILALCLIGVVLLQRSEGGGLGMGGGGGDGVMSSRQAATALAKLTWLFAICFIITSTTLTVLAARNASETSVIDQIGGSVSAPAPKPADTTVPKQTLPAAKDLLPPGSGNSGQTGGQSGSAPADTPAVPKSAD